MTDTLWCDISQFQKVVDDSYPYRWLAIRSNDGTYRDTHFQQNLAWAVNAANTGRLDGFFVYYVYEPGEDSVDTLKAGVGTPHPLMGVMIDVESWGGRIAGDHSGQVNAERAALASWLGNANRVIGYGNRGDLTNLWPSRGDTHIIYADYSGNPGFPMAFGHQFEDNANVAPFGGPVDLNSADGLTSQQIQQLLGLTPGTAPVPSVGGSAGTGGGSNITSRSTADIQRLVGATPDSIYGPDTTAKVKAWQAAHGLAADGIWGPKSDAVGFPPAASTSGGNLQVGSTGSRVGALQSGLNRVFPAYSKLAVDDDFGPATEGVVQDFQRRCGLTPDGIVGPITTAKLNSFGITF